MKKSVTYLLSVIGCSTALLGGFTYWQYCNTHPSTDNAYIKANIIQINANINGQVQQVFVKDNQVVKKGDKLFELDSRPLKIALKKAMAELKLSQQTIASNLDAVEVTKAREAQARAQLELDQKNTARILSLVKDGKASIADGDKAKAQLSVSQARLSASHNQYKQALSTLGLSGEQNPKLRQAQAALEQAKLNLSYSLVLAPTAGKIANFSLRPGDMVQQGHSIFNLIEQKQWWVEANYKETQLKNIKTGQSATITLDMYPDHPLTGTVSSISGGTGSTFSLLPTENAAGNWVKVTQRIPVKIALNNVDIPLAVGASATVEIDTHHG